MTTQPAALRLADWLIGVGGGPLAKDAAAELRRLHAENAHQHHMTNSLSADILKLHAEVEALRADAERYRWLKDHCALGIKQNGTGWSLNTRQCVAPDSMRDVDAAIDAAKERA